MIYDHQMCLGYSLMWSSNPLMWLWIGFDDVLRYLTKTVLWVRKCNHSHGIIVTQAACMQTPGYLTLIILYYHHCYCHHCSILCTVHEPPIIRESDKITDMFNINSYAQINSISWHQSLWSSLISVASK